MKALRVTWSVLSKTAALAFVAFLGYKLWPELKDMVQMFIEWFFALPIYLMIPAGGLLFVIAFIIKTLATAMFKN